jgi:predicted nuclease with TOPRIM domain
LKELVLAQPEPEVEASGFKGLGEVEINRIVDERFRERQRNAEYETLKERVMELTEENEELHDSIEELENENSRLEQELEGKKQNKYTLGCWAIFSRVSGFQKTGLKSP